MTMLKRIANRFLGAVAPGKALARRIEDDEWLRCMVVDVDRILRDPKRAEDDPAVQSIQALDAAAQNGLATYLIETATSVADAPDRLLACRAWFVKEAKAYAPVRALFDMQSTYSEDIANGHRHPCSYGLYERIDEVVALSLSKLVAEMGSVGAVVEALRRESLWLHVRLNFATLGLVALKDIGSDVENWVRPYFSRLVAKEEVELRTFLDWPTTCDVQTLDREIAGLEEAILSGAESPVKAIALMPPKTTR